MSTDEWPTEEDFDLDAVVNVWDRQPDEPSAAYAAFRLFRDLTPSGRTSAAVVAEASNVSVRTTHTWASLYHWRERAEAWDDTCHRIEDAERLEALRQMHTVHRRAGRAALTKGVMALNAMRAEDLTPSQAARLLELGARLERSTLIVSVEELQGLDTEEFEDEDDPWARIAAELDPAEVDASLLDGPSASAD